MDNQQETLMSNLNYFSGLIDSDFGVYIAENHYKGKLQLSPRINFVNTRFDLVEFCSNVLHKHGINHHVGTEKATVGKDHKRLVIQRHIKCVEFADTFGSYCVVRRPTLELLREFCSDRLKYVEDFGWKNKNTPYSSVQKNIFSRLRKMTLNYNSDNGYRNYTYSWLGGFIDGDGSIYISSTSRKSKYRKKDGSLKIYTNKKLFPVIKVTTESDTARNNVMEMYEKLGIRYYVETIKSKSKKIDNRKNKYYYSIIVKEFDDLVKLINKLDGKLLSKQAQLDLLREFIYSMKNYNRYTESDFGIVKKIKELNTEF